MAKKYGLRGRITAMWIIQTMEGFMCILLALVTISADGPEESEYPQGNSPVPGVYTYGSTEYTINSTIGMLSPCSSELIRSPEFALVGGVSQKMPVPVDSLVMVKDPAPNCVHNQNTLLTTMLCLVCFSICVQMAEGLHFGIVPYISRPALGVVAGMVGAGGNAGALIGGQFVIGNYDQLDQGVMRLGIVICTMSCIMHFIYFPEEGGILLPPGLPFNPQLIKEKKGQKGSDELDFSKTTTAKV